MKGKKLSIKWVVFGAIILFTVIMLGILWYFQIVHLNDFYENAKKTELQDAAQITYDLYINDELENSIDQLSDDYDISIMIIEADGTISLGSSDIQNNYATIINQDIYNRFYEEARLNDGTSVHEIDGLFYQNKGLNPNVTPDSEPEKDEENVPEIPEGETAAEPDDVEDKLPNNRHYNPRTSISDTKSVVYIRIITDTEGTEKLLVINSLITPVDATVYTLRKQFVYITIIFLVAAIALGVGISLIVSRPIVKINKSAKELATGDFDVKFTGTGYREVQELSDTLNYAAGELGRTEGLRKELIANVSHDLRTPLTMITAYSEMMRDLPGKCTPENAQVVIDESKRLTTLVNDMLDLSKLQAGVMQLELTTFDFTKNIMAVMERFARLKEQDGYDIRFEYRDDVKVIADEYKIYQVVYNLIINAINYAGEDKQVVVRQIVNGEIVRLEIEDHGRGIAQDELDNIWDRYYKIDKTHKRAVQGTGLGLSIVNNILKLHEAKFGVRSTVGKGSTFWFELHTVRDEE